MFPCCWNSKANFQQAVHIQYVGYVKTKTEQGGVMFSHPDGNYFAITAHHEVFKYFLYINLLGKILFIY